MCDMHFIIKAWYRNFVDFIGSYSMICALSFIHWRSQTFFIEQNIFVFTMTYCFNSIFIHVVGFFMLTAIIYQEWIHLWSQSSKFDATCFILHFTNNLFVWIIIIFSLSWIITKIKYFFMSNKILIYIFVFRFMHQTLIVSKQ